jgi:hypothetical protein
MSDSTFTIPTPKFCPACGSQNLSGEHWHVGGGKPPVEGYDCKCEEAERIGSLATSCRECGTHFEVSGVHAFPEEFDDEDDEDDEDDA